jgi:hypothetical protein
LAAKEDPFYADAVTKAAQLDLSRASTHMRAALAQSGILERPPPPRIPSGKLRCLGRICGLQDLPAEAGVAEQPAA